MKKFIITALVSTVLLLCGASIANAEGMILEYDGELHEYNGEVYALVVNNQLLDPPLSPIIFNDRALVPVREIFEEVGAQVNYIGETQTIEVKGEDADIELRINDNTAYVNGRRTKIPDNVVPKLISKVGGETKTMVPVRFISETIGLDVEFSSYDRAILIDSDGYTLAEDYEAGETEYAKQGNMPKTVLDGISYSATGNDATVVVTTTGAISGYNDFVLESPGRLVVDLQNGELGSVPENIEFNQAGISNIRLGSNGERARVVLDVENLQSYNVNKTSDTTLVITTTALPSEKPVAAQKPNGAYPNSSKLIVLDAGHGGSDSGAVGYLDGNVILEKNLTLEITNRVKNVLENAGYTVELTRTDDSLPSLSERPAQANAQNAAVFVSIHINSVDNAPNANGTEVYYASENNGDGYGTTSERLAYNILQRMLYYMGSTNRGVKCAEHAVTRRCNMPAALAEVGFITNPTEVYNMTTDDYQQKAAQGIAEGIMITLRDITMPE